MDKCNITCEINLPKEFKDMVIELIRQELKAQSQINITQDKAVENKLLSQGEICTYLDITLPTLIRHRKKGKIPYSKVGGRYLYEKAAVTDALRINNMRRAA